MSPRHDHASTSRMLLVPALWLAIAAAAWAGNILIGRAVRDLVDPVSLNLLRWGGAVLVLLPFTAAELIAKRHVLIRRWRYLCLMGLSGIALFQAMQYAALQTTQATNVALILATTPLIILVLGRLLLGDRTSRRQGFGALVSIIGAFLVITRSDLGVIRELRFNGGDLIEFAAVLFWALYCLFLRFRPPELGALAFIAAVAVPGTLFTLAGYLVTTPQVTLAPAMFGAVLYVVLVASVLAYLSWNAGIAALGAARGGVFNNLIPLFAALGAVFILGERFEDYHASGAALILIGLYFVMTPESRRR